MSAQTNEASVISSNEFRYDPVNRILTARAADLSPSFDLFNILDADSNRGFILDFNHSRIPVIVSEILPESAGWIYFSRGDDISPVAVFIDNT